MTNPSTITRIETDVQNNTDTIRVFLRECQVILSVGVYQDEMKTPQPVVITVELEAALPHHYQDRAEKKLNRVIDYEAIYSFIQKELPQMGHIYLLESIAEQIFDFCFRDVRVRKARVRLEKTAVFPAAAGAGIDITRSRPVP